MSMRWTLGTYKTAYNWPQFIGMSASDPRWLKLLNEALERIMQSGTWVGTWQRYQVCTNQTCLTWPRQFDTIIVTDVCNTPMRIRNEWYEFLEQGPGLYSQGAIGNPFCCTGWSYLDRGRGFVMFDDLRADSYIRLFISQPADIGKIINIRGYDSNFQWVTTNNGLTVGEDVALGANYVDTTTVWSAQVFREIIKAKTVGDVRAYSYAANDPYRTGVNPDGSPHVINLDLVTTTPIAYWEASETIPNYRRCVIPRLANGGGQCCGGSLVNTPNRKSVVTVMAKLAFIPLEDDLDILPLTNGPAIKMAMLSILKEERGDNEGARIAMFGILNPLTRKMEGGCIPMLDDELATYQGAGSVVPMRIEKGVDNAYVQNFI